jgi:hypothetical protein
MEKLAGVPEGTYDKLIAIKNKHNVNGAKTHDEYEARFEARYNEISDNPDTDKLDTFLTYGWGSFETTQNMCEEYHMDLNCGGLTDIKAVEQILDYNGIVLPPDVSIADLGGIHWC